MKSRVAVCVACVVLVAAVVGDVATLIYGHCCRSTPVMATGDGWPSWTHMLVGGGLLASSLLLFAVACVLPAQATFMCQSWLAVHVTWADDWARPVLAMLYDLQVTPVVDALGLTAKTAAVEDAEYWWWFVQGFIMMGLVRLAAKLGFDEEDEEIGDEDEEMPEVPKMMEGEARPPALEAPQCHLVVGPAMPRPAIEDIG